MGGVVDLIAKSGTNDLHGSMFEFFRNEDLDAKNFFAPAGPAPMDRQIQCGGSMGGPIRKNRLFFFADYEEFRYNPAEGGWRKGAAADEGQNGRSYGPDGGVGAGTARLAYQPAACAGGPALRIT